MAGVKGKSGGKRPGAGRKPVPPVESAISDAKAFLEGVIRGDIEANAGQINAAKALLPFQHQKLGEGGKKEQRQADAEKVSKRFTAATPPKLAAVGGKKV